MAVSNLAHIFGLIKLSKRQPQVYNRATNKMTQLNAYQIKWYFIVRFRSNRKQTVNLPKYLIKGTSATHCGDVIFTASKKEAQRIFKNQEQKKVTRLLSFVITDKQFGLINSEKASFIFDMMLPTSFGRIPISKKQQSGDWLNPATKLI